MWCCVCVCLVYIFVSCGFALVQVFLFFDLFCVVLFYRIYFFSTGCFFSNERNKKGHGFYVDEESGNACEDLV